MIANHPPDAPGPVARNHMAPPRQHQPRTIFAENLFRPAYAYPGIPPFIDGAAERLRFGDHSLRHRLKSDWFVTNASDALGRACHQRVAEAAQQQIDRAVAMRDALAVALAGVEAAIVETTTQLGLPDPPLARKAEVKHESRRLRRSVDPGE